MQARNHYLAVLAIIITNSDWIDYTTGQDIVCEDIGWSSWISQAVI